MAPPETQPVCEDAYPTEGHSGPLFLPGALKLLGEQELEHPSNCSSLPSDRAPIALGLGSLETTSPHLLSK